MTKTITVFLDVQLITFAIIHLTDLRGYRLRTVKIRRAVAFSNWTSEKQTFLNNAEL